MNGNRIYLFDFVLSVHTNWKMDSKEFNDSKEYNSIFIKTEIEEAVMCVESLLESNIRIKEEPLDHNIKEEYLTEECEIIDIKNEYENVSSLIVDPATVKKLLLENEKGNNPQTKKKKLYQCPLCLKNFQTSLQRKWHFYKNSVICIFCGKISMQADLYSFHYFSHYLKNQKTAKNKSDNTLKKAEICLKRSRNRNTYIRFHNKGEQYKCKTHFKVSKNQVQKPRKHCAMKKKQLKYKHFSRRFTRMFFKMYVNCQTFKCEICSNNFKTKDDLTVHMYCHSTDKPSKCGISQHTGEKYSSSLTKSYEVDNHSEEVPYKNRINNTVQSPTRVQSEDKPFKCDICCNSFTERSSLNRHIRQHSGEKPFKCEICLKSFTRNDELRTHMHCHNAEKPYKCDMCSKSFTTSNNLKIHTRCHTGDQPFKCEICTRSFTTSSHLKVHVLYHTGEKPFKCEICSMGFRTSNRLKKHVRSHTGEKRFECDICLNKFAENHQLSKHILRHSGEKPFKCEVCSRPFAVNSDLKAHMRYHSGEKPFKCEICSRSFTRSSNLKIHLRTHTGDKPFKCVICSKGFATSRHLKTHARCHSGDKPCTCKICTKSFTTTSHLKTHERFHTKEKQFQCEVCLRSFMQSSGLRRHVTAIHDINV